MVSKGSKLGGKRTPFSNANMNIQIEENSIHSITTLTDDVSLNDSEMSGMCDDLSHIFKDGLSKDQEEGDDLHDDILEEPFGDDLYNEINGYTEIGR
jgi:hypothetical protein